MMKNMLLLQGMHVLIFNEIIDGNEIIAVDC